LTKFAAFVIIFSEGVVMICKFAVRNFKGFSDWIDIDFSDIKNYEFNSDCILNGMVNTAILYGYNGVGKSNLGLAMFDIVTHLTDKERDVKKYQNYINADNAHDMAEFVYTFKFDTDYVEYRYGKKDIETIVYEKLSINNTEIVSYDKRYGNDAKIDLAGAENLNYNIKQLKISLVKYIKANTSLPETKESSLFYRFFGFIDNMLLFWQRDDRGYVGYETGSGDLIKGIIERDNFDNFRKFLEGAGLASDIYYVKENAGGYSILYKFHNGDVDFWQVSSTGTHSLMLFYYWFQRLKAEEPRPSFLFIDEFDAFYHQDLSKFVVSELKKNSCQVVLTTHNTGIMTNDLLRPDCYYLMYTDRIKSIASLADKELRFGNNIEKMYRAGAFDG
jgi:AAA15 family ATPase/GTPase